MVHHRLNVKEANPNPHVNFITALSAHDDTEQESARQLLRALAAQVRPIMKSHGLSVNSLEEYEHNNVFAGRNWNAGETIELVLRRQDRTFLPTFWLMSTLCHELAHIKHMDHGPAFQALWRRLRAEVRTLQDKGYYGDGYWSSGTRLADNEKVAGVGIEPGDLPEYMCGGAQTRRRPTVARTRRPRKPRDTTIIASTSTGPQTAKRRKAGARVTSKAVFVGEGKTLGEDVGDGKGKGKGTGFGKQAASKRAREERALVTERRILTSHGQAKATPNSSPLSNVDAETDSDAEEVDEALPETDSDRRKALLTSEKNEALDELKSDTLWGYFDRDCNSSESQYRPPEDPGLGCGMSSGSGSAGTTGTSTSKGKRRKYGWDDDNEDIVILPATKVPRTSDTAFPREGKLMVKEPVSSVTIQSLSETRNSYPAKPEPSPTPAGWACLVCTLYNEAEHLACSACATPCGDEAWTHG